MDMKIADDIANAVPCAGALVRWRVLGYGHRMGWPCALRSRHGWREALLAVVLVMTMAAHAAPQEPPTGRSEDTIARINGAVITRREFQAAYRQAVDRHARQGHPVDEAHIASLRRSVIQRLVEEELLFQESYRRGIAVSPEDIEAAAANARARFGDDGAFEQELERRTMTEAQFRRRLHRQLAIERLLEREVTPQIAVTEEEIRQYYEANPKHFQIPETLHLRHILVRRTADDGGDREVSARRKIGEVQARLAQGDDFAALARAYSEEEAAAQGGDLGYVQRGQMLPPLESAAFALHVGEVSPIVATDYGFHLLKLMDRRDQTTTPLEAARPAIRQMLREEKTERAVRALIRNLREKAVIQAAY